MAFLQIKNLSFAYPGSAVRALDGLNLTVGEGEMVLLIGASGCGKSTLLRHVKGELAPHGEKKGGVYYKGTEVGQLGKEIRAREIGFVLQNPETQIVTDTVWHELAFGLENLGTEQGEIRRKVAEMASFFGIDGWFRKSVNELSGGQKQILNLASIMAMQPKLLLLDEPTAQLDPIAAQDFLNMIARINRDLAVTVILSEHRLEEVFPLADQVVILDEGRILCADKPEKAARVMGEDKNRIYKGLPTPIRIYNEVRVGEICPLTVREGRQWLLHHISSLLPPREKEVRADKKNRPVLEMRESQPVLEAKEVWFKYGMEEKDVLRGVNLKAHKGEMLCVLGGNGTGKTTLLGVLAGTLKIKRGKVLLAGKKLSDYKYQELYRHNLVLLPQNPKALFVADTVLGDLEEAAGMITQDKDVRKSAVLQVMDDLEIGGLAGRHPYDLSGGEQQKVGIAKLLLLQPKIFLLDEPTKGMDAQAKEDLARIFRQLCSRGMAVVLVTHDVEFAAEYGDRCAMMFDGEIVSGGRPGEFFAGNSFYTTAANRMARGIFSQAVTYKDVIEECQKVRKAAAAQQSFAGA